MSDSARAMLVGGLAVLLGGCVALTVQRIMDVEEKRAELQKQTGHDIVQLTDTLQDSLPEDSPAAVRETIRTIGELGENVQNNAVKSERAHDAGGKIVGPPKDDIKPNTPEEDSYLVQAEVEARTVGKAREGFRRAREVVHIAAREGGGGLTGWVTGGGLVATLTAVGGLAEVGRRKLKRQEEQRKKEREEDEEKHKKEQEMRDAEQDAKLDAMMTLMNGQMEALRAQIEELTATGPITTPEGPTSG